MPELSILEDRALKALLAIQRNYEREITSILRESLDSIQGQLSSFYEKYVQEGTLSFAEMTKYNRLKNLETNIIGTLDPAIKKSLKKIDRLRPEMFNESFFRHAWAIDNSQGIRLQWGTLSDKALQENILNPFYTTFYEQAKTNLAFTTKAKVLGIINQGLIQGKALDVMARELRKETNIANYNALRIVRTETISAINAGQEKAYRVAEEKGVEGEYIWDATLDGRTRPDHADMDQEIRNEETGLFDGPGGEKAPYPGWQGLSAGQRINCRCRLRYQVKDFSPQLRRIREEGVMPYQTYQDWDKRRKK